jgi:hypothetical protein
MKDAKENEEFLLNLLVQLEEKVEHLKLKFGTKDTKINNQSLRDG